MRQAIPVLTAAAVAALVPATAQAKELASARACDAGDCRTVSGAGALRGMDEGQPASAPDERAPFYRVHMRVKVEGGKDFLYTLAYVPSAGLLRVPGQLGTFDWLAATPRGRRGFDRLTRGLEPLPAARLRGVGAAADVPVPRVDEVVPAPRAAPAPEHGGFAWRLLLIPGVLALAGATWAARRRDLTAPFRARRARA